VKVKESDTTLPEKSVNRDAKISDFDDLIFENRNKEYGAYQLRKKYNSVLLGGLIIASLIAITGVMIPFLLRPKNERVLSAGRGGVMIQMENFSQPEEQIYVPPAPPPQEPERIQEVVKYVPPVVVDTVFPEEIKQLTTEEVLASGDGEIREATGSGSGDGLIPGTGGGDAEEPFFQVEVMPSFKGGDLTRFREWVGKRTNYPQAAIDNKIRGTVFLTFIVEKDGSVSNVTVLKGIHPLLDAEAVKVISESPKWTPGLQRGQPVRVRFQIPLSFIY
jgi:protein TonB